MLFDILVTVFCNMKLMEIIVTLEICDTCKEEYIEETGEGKTKLRNRVGVHRQHI